MRTGLNQRESTIKAVQAHGEVPRPKIEAHVRYRLRFYRPDERGEPLDEWVRSYRTFASRSSVAAFSLGVERPASA